MASKIKMANDKYYTLYTKRYTLRNGSALALVLLVVVILLVMGLGLLSLGQHSRIFAIRTASVIVAQRAADAGVTKAVFEMNEKLKVEPWTDSTLPEATDEILLNCDAIFSYTVTGDIDSGHIVESIGESNWAERKIYADLGLRGLFYYSILSRGMLTLKPNTLIDGYNSDTGSMDVVAKIGTMSTLSDQIILNNAVIIDGDVIVGVDGNPDIIIKDLGATIEDSYSMTEEPPLPQIIPPLLTDMGTNIYVKGTTKTIGPSDSGKYTNIEIRQKSVKKVVFPGILEVAGGDVVLHITGNIYLGQSCEIVVKENTTLILYVDGNINCSEGSGLSNEGFPKSDAVIFYATGTGKQTFDLKANGDWYGLVYAPNADIVLYANGDIYGAFVANEFELKSGGNVYYDEALRDPDIDDEGVQFTVKRWSEQ